MFQKVFPLLLLCALPTQAVDTVIGTVTMPIDGNLSAAIYEPGGQIVRTLLEAAPQAKDTVVKLVWDGKDDVGTLMPTGKYQWKSIASQAKGVDDGWIGDMGNPPFGELSENGSQVIAVAVDSNGNVYETSNWEEAHEELRVWSPDGKGLMFKSCPAGRALAIDDQFIYQATAINWKDELTAIRRFTKDKFLLRNWMGTLHGNIEMEGGIVALAVDSNTVWVCGKSSVEIHDKLTGEMRKTIAVISPLAVAIDPQGHGWIANNGNRITEYAANGTKGREITGLKKPGALCFGGPRLHLYIGEIETGRVLEYDITNLQQVRALFSAAKPGPVSDTALLWPLVGKASLAVDSQGRITLADLGNRRVMTYNPDGTLLRQRFSEMQMAPMVDVNVNPDLVLSHNIEYQVNYQPGADYGKWKILNNWYGNGGQAVRRKIDNRQYMFSLFGKKNTIFDLTNGIMRMSAIISADSKGLYVWTDVNGDGQQQDTETVKTEGVGNFNNLGPGVWVDGKGNFWIANWNGETVMLPLDGIDAKGNPLYDWTHRKTVITKDNTIWKTSPANMRVDPVNGDIYRVGSSPYYTMPNPWLWMGGTIVERYTADGKRVSAFPILGGVITVVIATDSDGQYFYTGHSEGGKGPAVRMYTNDGLLVTICRMGTGPSGTGGGWMDHGLSMTAFTHPKTGVHYVYSEEVYWGKSVRFRIDNLNTLVRPNQGDFDWAAAE